MSESSQALLIEAAAEDFRLHVAAEGVTFRNVHGGVMQGDNGAARNLLCGSFRVSDQGRWDAFAIIETTPYENWLGDVAVAHCTGAGTILESQRDLSDSLTRHYRNDSDGARSEREQR